MDEHWYHMDETQCPCHGQGWAEVNQDWKECLVHYEGQLHPETRVLLLDEPDRLAEEERKSHLKYQISTAKEKIGQLQADIKVQQKRLVDLELELINRTVTKEMVALCPEDLIDDK